MNIREQTEKIEQTILSPLATLACRTAGRQYPEEEDDLRTAFQRDRDRIIHCKSFRRLKHKTQVFLSPEGDHYRTRLTHTLEVAQIARTIARCLRLNEDLTEAISLAHDLGHTPFGHAGEHALNEICSVSPMEDGSSGFRHYEQSVRIVERLEKNGHGLNLTAEVRDGILCHTCGAQAKTPEGRIVRVADRIAYINHDIEDSERAGILREDQLPESVTAVLGHSKRERIDRLVRSVVRCSTDGVMRMEPEIQKAFDDLHAFMYASVYVNPHAKSEEKKIPLVIEKLYEYAQVSEHLPEDMRRIAKEDGVRRAAVDYIAGMTDPYAVELFERVYVPHAWQHR
ncbi:MULTISPECIES: deoxyguanosinetriphosphate triphosphohydrolase [Caproicibacterium]|uniref:Deoxyguanosinetriphosphate triphosphohydrolase n=1 Tax=Caproicibacterium argilliputei TaxID=3030016 RepID=A0AA97D7P5_9FIRM|nr:deoxyguanosinetriphosphate triphosphohydrolase [Caproicibacterium argilliputei]WOC31197.1 deoxyguanosinetriphosphate triphosphohydrolase [Caproicibacterium argilliputei]